MKLYSVEHKTGGDELVSAARTGNIALVCELLKCGASVNSVNTQGHTPLKRAAQRGHLHVAQLLLTYGASVDKTKPRRDSPLLAAAQNQHLEVVKLLLNYNASVEKVGRYGFPPLFTLSKRGHTEAVKLLLAYNASVNKFNRQGWTALHMAAVRRIDIVELLCNAGAHVNAQTRKKLLHRNQYGFAAGSTALHIAVIAKNTRIVKTLISHRAELLKDNNGFTALDISRKKRKSTDITKMLEGMG